jgi:hypothetical protein
MTATVVILLSDKRSGSTLFEKEICKHPEIEHVQFTPHTYNETHYWVKAACLLSTTGESFAGGVRPDSYGSVNSTRQSLIKTIQGNVNGFVVPQSDEQLIFEGWNALCSQFARPVFFEKSPHHSHHWAALELILQWVETTDYRVRVIGLVRNPMAVIYSALNLFHTDPRRRQFGWVNGNRNILKVAESLRNEQFKLIRYEDLVTNPKNQFKAVCEFIGVDFQSHIGASANAHSLQKWREDANFDLQLDESVANFAKELGYNHEDLLNPSKRQVGAVKRFNRDLSRRLKRAKSRLHDKVKLLSE